MTQSENQPLDPTEYNFWYAPEGMSLTTGENTEYAIPEIPLPIKITDMPATGAPTEKAIGDGIYEYLCRFPFCAHAAEYARILQQAYPFLISDIGSQLILLDVKNVKPDAMARKIALLKILNHLEPENFGLLHKIGVANFDLALNYAELTRVKTHLKEARLWLEKARRAVPDDIANLNHLSQVCYLTGAYHQARLYWRIAADQVEGDDNKEKLLERIAKIDAGTLPERPLIESLEELGAALELIGQEEYEDARLILNKLEVTGDLPAELPNPEFYYILGLSREKCHDLSGAYEAYNTVLKLDKDHHDAREALGRIR
ncbi:MAG: hypothetical protein C0622_11080 [Desulfuromonas sp.]|nr:MAG: hypothetical protein C0622_11080 [Desulfuromonas sp.]